MKKLVRNNAVFERFVTNLLLIKYNFSMKFIEKIKFSMLIIYKSIAKKSPIQIYEMDRLFNVEYSVVLTLNYYTKINSYNTNILRFNYTSF